MGCHTFQYDILVFCCAIALDHTFIGFMWVSQGQNEGVSWSGLFSEGRWGESISKRILVVGQLQFYIGIRSLFFGLFGFFFAGFWTGTGFCS